MKQPISYLNQLKFDPKLWQTWYAKYLVQIRLVIMLILSIVAIGLAAYFALPRRLNPQVNIPIVIVSTVLPGASPEDMEQLVTIPLEDAIDNVEDIDMMTSSSRENISTVTIQFLSRVNKEKARDDVQAAVDSINDLPEDAEDPTVQALDFENQPVWTFVVTGPKDPASLKRFGKELQEKIEDVPTVDRAVTSGLDEQDITVVMDVTKIRAYGITPLQLSQAVQRLTASYPAGTVKTTTSTFSLAIDRDIYSVDDIRNIRVTINNQPIRLGDVATIGYLSKEDQQTTLFASYAEKAQPAVQFFVYKAETANIDAAEKDARKVVDETIAGYGGRFQVTTIENTAEEIVKQFNDLTRDFFFTVLLVFGLLFLFLGLKQAAIASITVPLTFLSAFAIINALGLSLNFLTSFAFLIALGLLIDDTIVVVAAMTRYYATGRFTPAETGVLVWKDFIVPLWSTTITTIWAFLPLLIASGIIGEFIKSIPIVVTATMLSSTSIAVLITLPLMIVFLKPAFPPRVRIFLTALLILSLLAAVVLFLPQNFLTPFVVILFGIMLFIFLRRRVLLGETIATWIARYRYTRPLPGFIKKISNKGLIDIEWLSHRYTRIIDRILLSRHGKRNVLIAITVFAICAFLLVPFGFVQNEFFPKQDVNLLYVNVKLPSGATSFLANKELVSVIEKVRKIPHISYVVGETGQSFSGDIGRGGDQGAFLITLHLVDKEERNLTSQEIAEHVRRTLKNYAQGTLSVVELSGGPPAGADIQISLLGDDLTQLDTYANQTMQFLQKQQGVTNVDKSIKPGTSKLVFVPDKEKLVENGLTVDAVALWLRTYASGFTLDEVKFGKEEETIIFRLANDTKTPEDLGTITVMNQQGVAVPLLSLGRFTLATNPTIITREEGKRTITVNASVVQGYTVVQKNQDLEKFAHSLRLQPGYTWKTGGVNEENQRSVNSIFQAMIISMLLILITMVIEFRSFRQTFLALMIIPLSVAGVLYVFALTATPLSFPALIGILSLFGIVVTHAIVVIEKINDNIREKLPLKDAIIDAAGSRLEPVLLTSLATIAGLIPVTLTDPLWRGLGGAIIAGLLFSGAIKLFFVPVVYYLMYQEKPVKKEIVVKDRE